MGKKKFLIVGLGNPEEERLMTRHNIGWRAIDMITGGKGYNEKPYGLVKEDEKGNIYLKPTVGMNSSGDAVVGAMKDLGFKAEELVIIVDDLDLPFGELRIKGKGGARHNGLKDIEEKLGTKSYIRVKVGIGHDFENGEQLKYVLGNFKKEEEEKIPLLLGIVRKAVELIQMFPQNLGMVMEKYNKRVVW